MKAKIIYIDKWFFGFDENGEITYDEKKMDRRRDVALMTWNNYNRIINEDYTIYIYKNKDREDGLWRPIEESSFRQYGYMNRVVEIKNNN